MKLRSLASLALLLALPAPGAARAEDLPKAPVTPMVVVRDTLFGTVVSDPYRWLEDDRSPETRNWLAGQETHFQQVMEHAPDPARIRARLTELRRTDDYSLPIARAGKLFYLHRGVDGELSSLTMRVGVDGKDQVLLDPMKLDPRGGTTVRILDVADDGKTIAVGIQKGGEDEVVVRFLDVATRRFRGESFPHARYQSVQFSGDARTVYYGRHTDAGPRLYTHRLGSDPAKDVAFFGDKLGRGDLCSVSLSDDGAWMVISVSHGSAGDKSELYGRDLRSNGPIFTIVNDLDARFDGRIGGDTLFVRTNWNAPNQRILAIDLHHPAREGWREVLKEGANPIESWGVAGHRLLVTYVLNVVEQVYLVETTGRVIGQVPVGDLGAVRGPSSRWSDPFAYLNFESYNVPPRILRVEVAKNDVTSWWKSSTPFRGEDYEVSQVAFASSDGKRVPMFLAMRKGTPRDGTAPVFLTGYGGFRISRTPHFSPLAAEWMENGGIWAEPALRGGGEFGEAWHKDGMLANKQHTFDDFIAAAEFLVSRRFTSKDRLAIAGGSNGGLLVGAALTQRPDLFRAVVCSVPLLDMLRYQKFLVARFWVPEYGSSEDSTQFRTLYAYSPYHHVRVGEKYPAILMVSGDSDTRVAPLHARKMTALLQSATGSDEPVILHYDTRSGHSGGKPRSVQIEDETDTLRFLFWQLGVEAREGAPPPLPPERPNLEHQPE